MLDSKRSTRGHQLMQVGNHDRPSPRWSDNCEAWLAPATAVRTPAPHPELHCNVYSRHGSALNGDTVQCTGTRIAECPLTAAAQLDHLMMAVTAVPDGPQTTPSLGAAG
jgi:hypothetical protein